MKTSFKKNDLVKLVNVNQLRKEVLGVNVPALSNDIEGREVVFVCYEDNKTLNTEWCCRVKGIQTTIYDQPLVDISEFLIPISAIQPVRITKPYCKIGDVKYRLFYDDLGVLRLPNYKLRYDQSVDLNQIVIDYANNKRPLSDLLRYYTETGASYQATKSVFSKIGGNNHIVKQGKEQPLTFKLYL